MSPIIQTPSIAEKLRRWARLKEGNAGSFLAEDVAPVVVVDDLSGAGVADQGYPREAIGGGNIAAGGAGTNAQCFWCPTGQAVVGRLHTIILAGAVATGGWGFQHARTSDTAITGLTAMDTRWADLRLDNGPNMALGFSTPLTAAIDGTEVGRIRALVNTTVRIPVDVVGANGGCFGIVNLNANESMQVMFLWTEYLLPQD